MTGTSAVTTTNQFLRIFRVIYNHNSSNVGTVTLRTGSATGTIVASD